MIRSVLDYSLDAAHSLDSLLSVWERPIRSMSFRMIGTCVVYMGRPIHSSYLGEGKNLKLRDPFYDNREFSNSYFLSPVWELSGNGVAFENSVE